MYQHPRQLNCPYCGSNRRYSAFSNTCADCGREIRVGQKTVSPAVAALVILAAVLAIVWAALVFA
jgi:uncharacterized protein (DUF983 family)